LGEIGGWGLLLHPICLNPGHVFQLIWNQHQDIIDFQQSKEIQMVNFIMDCVLNVEKVLNLISFQQQTIVDDQQMKAIQMVHGTCNYGDCLEYGKGVSIDLISAANY
jgi:hypothetical protein